MSEEENIRLVREIGEVKAELSGLKAEVAGTNQRLDDIVITQLKDHGKRLAMQRGGFPRSRRSPRSPEASGRCS